MKKMLSQSYSKPQFKRDCFAVVAAIALLGNLLLLQPTYATEANLDVLCRRLNSRCQGNQSAVIRDSAAQNEKGQVVKIKINDLAGVSEWVRAEISDRTVKVVHSRVSASGLARAIVTVGFPLAISHTWYDHPASRLMFTPDRCSTSQGLSTSSIANCTVLGTETVTLPADVDPFQGQFTIEYTESGFLRSATFRLPRKEASGG